MIALWTPYAVYWGIWFILLGLVAVYYVYQDWSKRNAIGIEISNQSGEPFFVL